MPVLASISPFPMLRRAASSLNERRVRESQTAAPATANARDVEVAAMVNFFRVHFFPQRHDLQYFYCLDFARLTSIVLCTKLAAAHSNTHHPPMHLCRPSCCSTETGLLNAFRSIQAPVHVHAPPSFSPGSGQEPLLILPRPCRSPSV